MSVVPTPRPAERHTFGWPAGSIRALLALMVVGLICLLILVSPADKPIPIPPYLIYLLFIVLGHFYAAHGNTISETTNRPPPLYLPRGFVRLLIIVLLVGTVAWELTRGSDKLEIQLEASLKGLADQPYLPLILVGGFFLGVVLHVLVGRDNTPDWFEDLEAYVSLLAGAALMVLAMIHLVINPSMSDPLETHGLQGFVAGTIAFYFGARS